MFGGWGLFEQDVMFALISGASLYFKVDDSTRGTYEAADSSHGPRRPSRWLTQRRRRPRGACRRRDPSRLRRRAGRPEGPAVDFE
ncbi:MAG: TfoX/Sxy family protein [Actinobacteria bacterium]|nr:TfoX/Sxy family protein [Actinomycetota bacterium]